MPIAERAAQFSPFAALTGYGDAVKETARVTDEKIELDEDAKEILDEKGFSVDEKGFAEAMEEQKVKARSARKATN